MKNATGSQKVNLPPVPQSYNPFAFTQAFDSSRCAFLPVVTKDEATPRILLQSPNGTTYELTVNDNGTLAVATGSTITLKQKIGRD